MNEYTLKDNVQRRLLELSEKYEYWPIEELMLIYGYKSMKDFLIVIDKAKQTCKIAGLDIIEHFGDEGNLRLTKYASYLISIRADSDIIEVIYARMFFAINLKKLYL